MLMRECILLAHQPGVCRKLDAHAVLKAGLISFGTAPPNDLWLPFACTEVCLAGDRAFLTWGRRDDLYFFLFRLLRLSIAFCHNDILPD
jgi:hypothetical protein